MSSPVTLTAETPAAVPVVTLGSGLPTQKDGQPVYYRRRTAAYARTYDMTHPGTRELFKLSGAMLDKAMETARRRAKKGILPFLTPYHVDHRKDPDARDTLGYAIGFERDGDDLVADLQLIGDDALKTSTCNRVSIYMLPDGVDADGEQYENVIHHIAFTPNEALHGMGDQVPLPIAASAAGLPPLEVKAYALCATTTDTPPTPADAGRTDSMPLSTELKARLAKLVPEKDIPAEPDAEFYIKLAEARTVNVTADPAIVAQVTALSAKVTTLEGERDAEKAKVLQLSAAAPREMAPHDAAAFDFNVATLRESAIAAGAVSSTDAAKFDALLMPGGKPGVLALSASGENRHPFAYNFWRAMKEIQPGLKLNAAVDRVPAQLPPLSGAGGDTDYAKVTAAAAGKYIAAKYGDNPGNGTAAA